MWLEWLANAAATLSIVLAARNSVHTWWIGIVGCVPSGAGTKEHHLAQVASKLVGDGVLEETQHGIVLYRRLHKREYGLL